MVGDRAYFRPKEGRYRRNGILDVDAIPLQLLDALGQELVVVNEGPEVSVIFGEWGRLAEQRVSEICKIHMCKGCT